MRNKPVVGAILAIAGFCLGGEVGAMPVISVDLDTSALGIQATRTLAPGDAFSVDIVYTGDGEAVFDTFALDVVFNNTGTVLSLPVQNPTAGPIADTAPTLALDVFGALPVTSGGALTIDSFLAPLGFEDGLGGVGISSVGGTPFPLVGDGETIGLFRLNLSAAFPGTSTVASTGFPFGANAELALAGVSVPVTLQSATVTVVPVPPALGLLATGLLMLLGAGRRTRLNRRS
jgi:hypothetical protein